MTEEIGAVKYLEYLALTQEVIGGLFIAQWCKHEVSIQLVLYWSILYNNCQWPEVLEGNINSEEIFAVYYLLIIKLNKLLPPFYED